MMLTIFAFGCRAAPASQHTGCASQLFPDPGRSYRAIDFAKAGPGLSLSQWSVVQAVLHASPEKGPPNPNEPSGQRSNLMYSIYAGSLILYYGVPAYPDGLIPPNNPGCPESLMCREGYDVIGTQGVGYVPHRDAGIEGLYFCCVGDSFPKFSIVDIVARKAYAKEHVAGPEDYFKEVDREVSKCVHGAEKPAR
ncbi:MAG: hypothetical protein M3R51_02450 [Candidatus Eremiobacteraeota bacterium]|nr:hypothetical protein [Candidatus Eremiobacteraeota bacterium]